ncbi:MAG: hypothetical protein AB7V44_02975 [Pseudonocardia sp.]
MTDRPQAGRCRPGRPPRRVTVTSPQTRLALARPRSGPPRRQPRLPAASAARARWVRRRQLRFAVLGLAVVAALAIGGPLLLWLAPGLVDVQVAGMPLAWFAVAILPYPMLAAIAAGQLRGAERIERDGSP